MRLLEQNSCISQMESICHSTHSFVRNPKGCSQQFIDNGRGKTKNTDYETLHYTHN